MRDTPDRRTDVRGACLCGAVAFGIAPPYRWFAHCHCSLCRKHHGSLFGTGLGVARDRFEWLRGADDVVHYSATTAFERPFCRHCGSTLPAVSHDDRFWHVPAGLLDGDPGARPRSHIFVASKSPLYELADALPHHAAYPPGLDVPTSERRTAPTASGTITGSCLCDGIAFSATAVLRRLVNCYCSLCRRRSGAAFTSTLLVPTADFRWAHGETRIRHYAMPSPRQYSCDFCPDCGSPTASVITGQPRVFLPAGAIDDPWKSPKGDTELPPLSAVHVYVGSKAPWVAITDDGPQFAELPPATLGSPRRGAERFTEFFQ